MDYTTNLTWPLPLILDYIVIKFARPIPLSLHPSSTPSHHTSHQPLFLHPHHITLHSVLHSALFDIQLFEGLVLDTATE